MKKIGFVGAYDQKDLVLNVAKVLEKAGNRVLVIDATLMQKMRYSVPTMEQQQMYITDFKNVDVAIGFFNLQGIMQYLNAPTLEYEYILVSVDSIEAFTSFNLYDADTNFFVTSFDLYDLQKGIEILSRLKTPVEFVRVLVSIGMDKKDEEYFRLLASKTIANWSEHSIYISDTDYDRKAVLENQRVEAMKFKTLSQSYKDNLIYINQIILGGEAETNLRRVVKQLERGV